MIGKEAVVSGHSKWAGIKHKKALIDAQRGKLFTKLIREITVAARDGGGDEKSNPRLRRAVISAKEANMPFVNIERAIKKGTGELPGVCYEEIVYEGYASSGIAIVVECLTDNKNRTAAEIRKIFSKKGGNLASAGAVTYMFRKKGLIIIDKKEIDEDRLLNLALQAGAEDIEKVISQEQRSEKEYRIITSVADFENVKEAVKNNGIRYSFADLNLIPNNQIKLSPEKAKMVLALIDELENSDDVQNVYSNLEIDE